MKKLAVLDTLEEATVCIRWEKEPHGFQKIEDLQTAISIEAVKGLITTVNKR